MADEIKASAGPQGEPELINKDEKIFAALSYVPPLFILTLIVKPKSEFCTFHVKQSIGLFLVFMAYLFLFLISALLGSLITLPLFLLYCYAIYKAYQGVQWKIPVLGALFQKLNFESFYKNSGLASGAAAILQNKVQDFADRATDAIKKAGEQKNEEQSEQKP